MNHNWTLSILLCCCCCCIQAGVTRVASRSLHTSRPVYMGGANAPDYVHAPKMYTIKKMKNRKLKFGAMIGGAAILGFGIPFWAVKFTQSKTGA
mmetsp:Transcript_41035/g.87242  ORF Transcript_41035/g.87242 Transcript_41035/m.87242 type:complete len:94 (-) Transcript_41035:115-396(-)